MSAATATAVAAQFGGGDPRIGHVDARRDADHYPRVVPGRMCGQWAACGDCRGAVRARWTGPERSRLEVGG